MSDFLCPICGSVLAPPEEPVQGHCLYCGREEPAELACPQGHYVCEECRIAGAREILLRYLAHTSETDALVVLNNLLKHPAFPMHSIEHHCVVGPVAATVLRNRGVLRWPDGANDALVRRTEGLPYGGCGSMGICGACASAGALLSRLTKAGFRSDAERARVLELTAAALAALAKAGGPRCCKQSVYLSLRLLDERLQRWCGLSLRLPPSISCVFHDRNPECERERCEFFVPPDPG